MGCLGIRLVRSSMEPRASKTPSHSSDRSHQRNRQFKLLDSRDSSTGLCGADPILTPKLSSAPHLQRLGMLPWEAPSRDHCRTAQEGDPWAVLGVHGAPGTPTGSRPGLYGTRSECLAPQAQAPHHNPGYHILPEEEVVPMEKVLYAPWGSHDWRGGSCDGTCLSCPTKTRGGHALDTPESSLTKQSIQT